MELIGTSVSSLHRLPLVPDYFPALPATDAPDYNVVQALPAILILKWKILLSTEVPHKPIDPFTLINKMKNKGLAPVHLWNPPFCGDIDMRILRDGTWVHEGKPIRRKSLVQLFASILSREADGQYYLVTPVEKVGIQVDDCPFIAVLLDVSGKGEKQRISFTTNTEEVFILDAEHALAVTANTETGEPHPVIHVRSGLYALLARNVFYQLVALSEQLPRDGIEQTGVWSCGAFYNLDQANASS